MKIRDWVLLGFGVAFVLFCAKAEADPLFRHSQDGVVVTLHSEKCSLPAVTNLPLRATWLEGGVTTEGCYAAHPQFPIVVFYFADKTVAVQMKQAFTRIAGA